MDLRARQALRASRGQPVNPGPQGHRETKGPLGSQDLRDLWAQVAPLDLLDRTVTLGPRAKPDLQGSLARLAPQDNLGPRGLRARQAPQAAPAIRAPVGQPAHRVPRATQGQQAHRE